MMFFLILYDLFKHWSEWVTYPMLLMLSVSVAVDVDTSKLQVNMTVILSVMGFLSDKFMWSHQTGSAAPAWQPHTETTDTESTFKSDYKFSCKFVAYISIWLWWVFYLYVFYVTESFSSQLPTQQRFDQSAPKLLKFQNALWNLHLLILNYGENLCFSQGCGQIFNICGEQSSSFVGVMVFP